MRRYPPGIRSSVPFSESSQLCFAPARFGSALADLSSRSSDPKSPEPFSPLCSKPRHGVAAVELAVLLPFLMFLFLVTVDFARIFYFTQMIENCARKGALYASDPIGQAQSPYSSVQNAALAADAANLNPQPTVTSVSVTDASGNPAVQVTVAWPFQSITSFPGIPKTFNLNRTVQMRVAQ